MMMNTKCYCGHTTTCDCEPQKILEDNIKQFENCIKNLNESFAKQETLEEAAYKYTKRKELNKTSHLIGFKKGAKWQAEKSDKELEVAKHLYLTALKEKEQMCTKEDMWESYKESNTIFGDEIALRQEFEEWFEKFKKK